jgi:hypothetical protein
MSVVLITNWIAARAARYMAESMSSDPAIRAAARARAIAAVNRREQRAKRPYLAEVVQLDTRRTAPRRPVRTVKDY